MQPDRPRHPAKVLRSSVGAFDLPSILVGVVVVAILTAGVLAAIFGVIPFAQDSGAKQDLDSVRTGEGVAKAKDSKYVNLAGLDSGGYVKTRPGLAVGTDANGACYVAVSHSGSGRDFIATSKVSTPVELTGAPDTGCIPASAVADLASQAGGKTKPAGGMMRTTWDTSIVPDWGPDCTTITLPLTGAIDATVNWGDGSTEKVTTELPAHAYSTQGAQNISIDGTFTGWVGNDWPRWSSNCLTKVTEWGATGTTDAAYGFAQTRNLTEVTPMPLTVTSFADLFYGSAYNGDISGWNTSHVTNMSEMFYNSKFNQPIGKWDTSQVTNMSGMFDYSPFNQPIGDWNTSSLTSMSSIFADDYAFNQSLARWNTSHVTAMDSAFNNASAFNTDVSGWDTSKVTDMSQTFHGSGFTGDISRWNTSSVTNMYGIFSWSSFNGDVSKWDTSKVTSMGYMFQSSPFNGDISNWNTSSAASMGGMFELNGVFNGDISRWDTSNVTDMSMMFDRATAFNTNIGGWNTSNVTGMYAMFSEAGSFNQDLSGWNVSNVTEAGEFRTGSGLAISSLPVGALFN